MRIPIIRPTHATQAHANEEEIIDSIINIAAIINMTIVSNVEKKGSKNLRNASPTQNMISMQSITPIKNNIVLKIFYI